LEAAPGKRGLFPAVVAYEPIVIAISDVGLPRDDQVAVFAEAADSSVGDHIFDVIELARIRVVAMGALEYGVLRLWGLGF